MRTSRAWLEADKNYSDFLQTNLLDGSDPTGALDGLAANTGGNTGALDKLPGFGSILPVVADSGLATTVFGDGLYDKNLMQALSGQTELFQTNGRAARQSDVRRQQGGSGRLHRKGDGASPRRMGPNGQRHVDARFYGLSDRLLQKIEVPAGVNATDYKTGIREAVGALIQGGALVSQAQPTDIAQPLVVRDADGNFIRQSGLNTYSKDEISAMIAAATGLAGRSRADTSSRSDEPI
ncbi:hypothetical protein ACOJBO_02510 [Rhizobium beringeri]